jgi:hypothetical protein
VRPSRPRSAANLAEHHGLPLAPVFVIYCRAILGRHFWHGGALLDLLLYPLERNDLLEARVLNAEKERRSLSSARRPRPSKRECHQIPPIETMIACILAAGVETGQLCSRRCVIFRPLTAIM